jgi:hypothetical protein
MNVHDHSSPAIIRWARSAALTAGILATLSMVGVLLGEVALGEDFMGSTSAQLLGWGSFAASAALVLGIAGIGAASGRVLSPAMTGAWAVLMLGTVAAAGGAATLALVVPTLAERLPELATNPPASVPATFILSGLVMGVAGVVLGLGLRRAVPELPRWTVTVFVVGSVVAIVPLPSRYFLLAFGVAAVLTRLPAHAGTASARGPREVSGVV